MLQDQLLRRSRCYKIYIESLYMQYNGMVHHHYEPQILQEQENYTTNACKKVLL